MIVKFENFVSKADGLRENMLFLFHGPNQGKVEDCTSYIINLKKEKNDLELINLYSEELKKGELSKVFNENRSLNLFGNKVLLKLYVNNDKIGKEFVSLLSKLDSGDLTVIVKSDQLSSKSLIRSFFEKDEKAVCVPCYEENSKEKLFYIKNYLKNDGVDFNISELNMLSNSLPNERLEIKRELEKIIVLFKCFGKQNSFDFFLSHISESSYRDQSKFILSLSSKQTKDFIKNYNYFTNFGADNIKLVSYLLEHFFRLLVVKNKLYEGFDIKEALRQLKPPVFFKDVSFFEKQVMELTFEEINEMIKKLYLCKGSLINGNWTSHFSVLFALLGFLKRDTR